MALRNGHLALAPGQRAVGRDHPGPVPEEIGEKAHALSIRSADAAGPARRAPASAAATAARDRARDRAAQRPRRTRAQPLEDPPLLRRRQALLVDRLIEDRARDPRRRAADRRQRLAQRAARAQAELTAGSSSTIAAPLSSSSIA